MGTSIHAVCVAVSVTMLVFHVHAPDAIIHTATMIVSILRNGDISRFKVNLSDLLVGAADCAVTVTIHCRRVHAQDVLRVTSVQIVLLLLQRNQRQLARDATCGTELMCAHKTLLQNLYQSYVLFATVNTRAVALGTSINAVCVAVSVTILLFHVHAPDAIINTATMIVTILRIGYISHIKVNLSDLLVGAADCAVKVTVH